MEFSLVGHPLLGDKAKALHTKDSAAFDAQAELAAFYFGLDQVDAVDFSAGDLRLLEHGLVLQLNYQLALDPGVFIKLQENSTASHQGVTYRLGIGLLSPQAAKIIENVVGRVTGTSKWDDLTSVRSSVR